MNLIYIYSMKYELLGQFHAGNGYGIKTICGILVVDPSTLPNETQTNLVRKQKRVIVKRMD